MNLNGRSLWLVEAMLAQASVRRVQLHPVEKGGRFVDCGIEVQGGLRAGIDLARICLADLAEVTIIAGVVGGEKNSDLIVVIIVVFFVLLGFVTPIAFVYEFIMGESVLSKLRRRAEDAAKQKGILTKLGKWLS